MDARMKQQLLEQAAGYVLGAKGEIRLLDMQEDIYHIECSPCYELRLKHAKEIIDLLLRIEGDE